MNRVGYALSVLIGLLLAGGAILLAVKTVRWVENYFAVPTIIRTENLKPVTIGSKVYAVDVSSFILGDHIVRMNRDGLLLDPAESLKKWPLGLFSKPAPDSIARRQIHRILDNAVRLGEQRGEFRDGKPLVKLLVHVHGGLNSFRAADTRMFNLTDPIKNDSIDWHYPVFISWPSGPLSAWAEATFTIRDGYKIPWLRRVLDFPGALFAGVVSWIAEYPAIVSRQGANESNIFFSMLGWNFMVDRSWQEAEAGSLGSLRNAKVVRDGDGNVSAVSFSMLTLYPSQAAPFTFNDWIKFRVLMVTAPVRYSLGTAYHGVLAVHSWQNMKRRTQNAFYPPRLFDRQEEARSGNALAGGDFFKLLLGRIQRDTSRQWEITLVGHSMGAIFLNHALVAHRESWLSTGALKNIVYMGAACSIEEGFAALGPILNDENPARRPVNFYNLTLNKLAEGSENSDAPYWGLIPTGSLLVSIDQQLERPDHPLGRRLGAEINLLTAAPLINQKFAASRGNVMFKSFNLVPGRLPAKHGDFNLMKFWKYETWTSTVRFGT